MYYFDNLNASEPDKDIRKEINDKPEKIWAGLSLTHSYSQQTTAIQEESRFKIAQYLDTASEKLIFLSDIKEAIDYSLLIDIPQRIISLGYCSKELLGFLRLKSYQLGIEYKHFSINFEKNEVLKFLKSYKNTYVYVHHFNLLDFQFFPVKQAIHLLHTQESRLFLDISETIGKLKISVNHIPADYIFASGNLLNTPKHSALGVFKNKELVKKIRAFENQELYLNLFFEKAFKKAIKKPIKPFLSSLKTEFNQINLKSLKTFFNPQIPYYLKVELPIFDSFRHQSLAVKFDLAQIALSFFINKQKNKIDILFIQSTEIQDYDILVKKLKKLVKWYLSKK